MANASHVCSGSREAVTRGRCASSAIYLTKHNRCDGCDHQRKQGSGSGRSKRTRLHRQQMVLTLRRKKSKYLCSNSISKFSMKEKGILMASLQCLVISKARLRQPGQHQQSFLGVWSTCTLQELLVPHFHLVLKFHSSQDHPTEVQRGGFTKLVR